MTEIQVKNNPELSRFEAVLDGEVVGHMTYRLAENAVVIPHTEVDPDHGGKGIGGKLVRGSLDAIRGGELGPVLVQPACPFVADFIEANQEYHALLVHDDGEPIT